MTCERKYIAPGVILLGLWMLLPAKAQELPIDTVRLTGAVMLETNAYRKSKSLPELQRKDALDEAASLYAKYLAEHDASGHTADGSTPAKRVSAQGYKWCFVAENMMGAWRRPDPYLADELAKVAMDGWKKSPGHNANLLDKRSKDIGIGAAAWRLSDGRVVFRVVQAFGEECPGKPRPAPSLRDLFEKAGTLVR
ncbi:MAG: CAP domain-containing protein [Rhodomicrobium sp.]